MVAEMVKDGREFGVSRRFVRLCHGGWGVEGIC